MEQRAVLTLSTVLSSIFLFPIFIKCFSQPSMVSIELCLKTPKGLLLEDVAIRIDGVPYGSGGCVNVRLTPGIHFIEARWMNTDLILPPLVVSESGTITLIPTNVHTLTVRVLGAQGQAIEGATVRVMKDTVELTRLTDKDGKAEIELPASSYNIDVTYGNFRTTESVALTADTVKIVNLDVFLELFGVGMTMAQFLLLSIILMAVIITGLVILLLLIKRMKRK